MLHIYQKILLTGLLVFPVSVNACIFGTDDRLELWQATPEMQAIADSVPSLWTAENILLDSSGENVVLKTKKASELYKLCNDVKFQEQPSGASCSGVLVGPDLVATAGHCIDKRKSCGEKGNLRVVFGFAITKNGGSAPESLPASEVYSCREIIISTYTSYIPLNIIDTTADYALIRLNRPVTGHKYRAINNHGSVSEAEKLFMASYPLGMPLKVSPVGEVRDTTSPIFFTTNHDTMSGSSGGPVFNTMTKELEGILARSDFSLSKAFFSGCNATSNYSEHDTSSNHVMRISLLKEAISRALQQSSSATSR